MIRVVVVGARSARQGTGPFVAGAFNQLGAQVCGVVGTRASTVKEAVSSLRSEYGIECTGYIDLAEAIALEKPDVVAICSPYRFHAGQLAQVAAANCHCLVEKPLAWPALESELAALVGSFTAQERLLQLVTQWPQTLPAFLDLHGPLPQTITDFAMGLSPISIGPDMVPDAGPHFISMLQALLGPGEFEQIAIAFPNGTDDAPSKLVLECVYRHLSGRTRAQLLLETCATRPRPAWYQINQLRADRKVTLPQYRQQLVCGEMSAAIDDPLESVVAHFMAGVAAQSPTDSSSLRLGHRNLRQLAKAWPVQD